MEQSLIVGDVIFLIGFVVWLKWIRPQCLGNLDFLFSKKIKKNI